MCKMDGCRGVPVGGRYSGRGLSPTNVLHTATHSSIETTFEIRLMRLHDQVIVAAADESLSIRKRGKTKYYYALLKIPALDYAAQFDLILSVDI